MEVIDIIILCCFLPAIYFGLKNGLVKQIVSACVIYFGITLSLKYSIPLSGWIAGKGVNIPVFWTRLISFILIFAITAIIFSLLGKVVSKIIKITLLGWVDKLLGIILSLLVSAIIISVIIYFVDSANSLLEFIPKEKIAESKFYPALLDFAKSAFPLIKDLI